MENFIENVFNVTKTLIGITRGYRALHPNIIVFSASTC